MRRGRSVLSALLLMRLAACSDTTTPSSPGAIAVTGGANQTGAPGETLATPLQLKVTTFAGAPLGGVVVNFAVSSGDGSVSPISASTDAAGLAETRLTLGSVPGVIVVVASVEGSDLETTIEATLAEAAVCQTGTATAVGTSAPVDPSATLCVRGGTTGGEFALVAFNGGSSASSRSFSLQTSGTTTVSSWLSQVAASAALTVTAALHHRVDLPGRRSAAQALVPSIGAARTQFPGGRRPRTALRSAIPASPIVGDVVSLNASSEACISAMVRTARIAAVTSKAIVIADVNNPSGGFTDSEYATFAETFTSTIFPLELENFGEPSDIDGNGRVVLFFTRAVNALTPRNADYYIGGFFHPRDLFPVTASADFEACATSNEAEMFYLLVPDPSGSINGNEFSKSSVATVVNSIVAHEFQHLINASRRMFANTTATDFEAVWLDEGLSHIAEELLFYRRSGLAPRQNLDAATLRSSSVYRDAFNDDAIDNFSRFAEYLAAPATFSPLADDDDLATRGAIWSFLRFAADRDGGNEAKFWHALVNSTETGTATLELVLGAGLTNRLRDWTTAVIADDIDGAAADVQQPSWNLRSILEAIEEDGRYPLKTLTPSAGVPVAVSVRGGTSAFVRFGVMPNATATISWSTPPSNVQFTLVRLR